MMFNEYILYKIYQQLMSSYSIDDYLNDEQPKYLRMPKLPCDELILIQSNIIQLGQSSLEQFYWKTSSYKLDSIFDKLQQRIQTQESLTDKPSAFDSTPEEKQKIKQKQSKSKIGCNCKKSSCLKSYCECYSIKGYCSQGCSCVNCKNNAQNRELVEVSKSKKKIKDNGSTSHCQCKKSKCQKNYCECFSLGVSCGPNCKCTGCENCQNTTLSEPKNENSQAEASKQAQLQNK